MKVSLPREEWMRPAHPENLRLRRGPPRLRVDHWVNDAIQGGHGAWEGDPRYCLYANPVEGTWELWRLEHDGEYRIEGRQKQPGPGQHGQRLGNDLLDTILTQLVKNDIRRGYDPVADIDAHDAAREREWDRNFGDWAREDFADRLKHALIADGEHRHVTGL